LPHAFFFGLAITESQFFEYFCCWLYGRGRNLAMQLSLKLMKQANDQVTMSDD
jgi:hypothetical protein